jgi:succinyl-CoA synthetase beta subunit
MRVLTPLGVDLFEYQARDVFEKHGVPVLAGAVATTPEQAREAAEEIGAASGGVTVVKAQVKTGGRGKAGGVKVAKSADEAEQHASADPRHGHQGPHRHR